MIASCIHDSREGSWNHSMYSQQFRQGAELLHVFPCSERKQEGSKDMDQKVYKVMKGAGATNIALGVITLITGIVTGILLIIAGAKLTAGKSRILF